MDELLKRIIDELKTQGKKQYELTDFLGVTPNAFGNWKAGTNHSYEKYLYQIAAFLGVTPEYLKGEAEAPRPNVTDDYSEFPIIGEVAAGFDHYAVEDWSGETIKIPNDYLRGRSRDEFFVLRVKGDSMSPLYLEGDYVLVLKQSTLNYSGQIGVVVYEGEYGTLKKVEYVYGEDWMRMVPVNPTYRPVLIEGADLQTCKVLGIPWTLIRNFY